MELQVVIEQILKKKKSAETSDIIWCVIFISAGTAFVSAMLCILKCMVHKNYWSFQEAQMIFTLASGSISNVENWKGLSRKN